MRTAAILLLCILGAALFCTVSCNNSNGPDNCCFKFFPGTLSPSRVRSFILTDDRCPKPGVISQKFCESPTATQPNLGHD
uniref:Chemokine interleukin-8-like domain-containing protein n=1 Tax=Oryzias latipes TaxID=8090 RepID=A0A3P9MAI4_ORYLA